MHTTNSSTAPNSVKKPHSVENPHSVEEEWQILVSAALVGTERRSAALPILTGTVGELLQAATENSPDVETQLLRASAILSLYRQAGRLPEKALQPLPAPCERQDLPSCSVAAGQRLLFLLDGQPVELLEEWLALTANAEKRAPDAFLRALLEYARSHPRTVDPILAVLGERGRWLAAQNPDWSFAAPATAEELWQTGTRAQRGRLLTQLRSQDADAARHLLSTTWGSEAAAERAFFLGRFVTGLGPDDEPFLEAALDDRSQEVRRVAVDLLTRLPMSALVARMHQRAQQLLHYEAGRWPLRAERLTIQLLDHVDESMQRDGVALRGMDQWGEKSTWTYHVLSAVPPWHWSNQWRRTPAELIKTARNHEHGDLLFAAWVTATVRFQDMDWAVALLQHGATNPDLLAVLPAQEQARLILEKLKSDSSFVTLNLAATIKEWSLPLSREVVRRLPVLYSAWKAAGEHDWEIRRQMRPLHFTLDPSVHNDVDGLLGKLPADAELVSLLSELLNTLQLRIAMRQEINE